MERLGETRPSGMNTNGLRTWGMLFVVAGIIGRSVLQKQLLGVGTVSGTQLLEVMQNSGAMAIAAAALVLLAGILAFTSLTHNKQQAQIAQMEAQVAQAEAEAEKAKQEALKAEQETEP